MLPPVAATEAMAFSIASRVTKCDGRRSARTRSITRSPVSAGRLVLGRVLGRDAVEPGRGEAEELGHHRHRVRRELAPARTGAGARCVLDLVQLLEADLAGPIGADRLEHRHDGRVALALVDARVDRAVVEDDARDVEAAERHDRAGGRLVAADEADEAVEEVARD